MRIFVSEYCCGGGWPEPEIPVSLAREGEAMLRGLLTDLAQIPGCSVVTTWSACLPGWSIPGVNIERIETPVHEAQVFERLARSANVSWIIAPETGGVLVDRIRRLEAWGVRHIGCSSAAIDLTTDKLRLAEHWQQQGLPTIPTNLMTQAAPPLVEEYPQVVKLGDGAGSQSMALLHSPADWIQWWEGTVMINESGWIRQPFVPGTPISVAVLSDAESRNRTALPVAQQFLTPEDLFQYRGGILPATVPHPEAIQELALQGCRSVPGLSGWVGVDLLVPPHSTEDAPAILVEINPRLTTSYLGYRALCRNNLAASILDQQHSQTGLHWKDTAFRFTAAGLVT